MQFYVFVRKEFMFIRWNNLFVWNCLCLCLCLRPLLQMRQFSYVCECFLGYAIRWNNVLFVWSYVCVCKYLCEMIIVCVDLYVYVYISMYVNFVLCKTCITYDNGILAYL